MNNLSLSDLHQATSEELLLLIIGNKISLLLHIVAPIVSLRFVALKRYRKIRLTGKSQLTLIMLVARSLLDTVGTAQVRLSFQICLETLPVVYSA